MADGVDATSFEFYEGIRIILPGALTVALADAVVRTASSDGKGLGLDTLPAVIASVLIGLVFYFIDAPTKSTVYRTDQPTATLAEFGTPKDGTTAGNNYFVILDVNMPPGIKARALYMGSMFRIGYEATFLLVVTSAVVLSQPLWTDHRVSYDPGRMPEAAWVGIGAMGVAWGCARYGQWIQASRRGTSHRARTASTRGDIATDGAVSLFAGASFAAILAGAHFWDVARWVLMIPAGIGLLHWTYRYSKGYPKTEADRAWRRAGRFWSAWQETKVRKLPRATAPVRRRASSVEATRALAFSGALLLAAYVAAPSDAGWLSQSELKLWVICFTLGVTLVVARGHEIKLGGAYATQRTWLLLNRDALAESYCVLTSDDSADSPGGPRPNDEADVDS
ncbi:MAG: hypothetical protein KDB63_16695 [Nocardioidaceae bacterium]|nr:hypothetical protein [Nocardioidaceae bacterium]